MTNPNEEKKQPAGVPVARLKSEDGRERMVPLNYPVEFDGKLWEEVRIRKITGRELADYIEVLQTSPSSVLPPMIDCPIEVWDAMDADDQADVDDAAQAFTPRRLKAAVELSQGIGGDTSVSSATPSPGAPTKS